MLAEAAALNLRSWVWNLPGGVYNDGLVKRWVQQGPVNEKQVDSALAILLQTRF